MIAALYRRRKSDSRTVWPTTAELGLSTSSTRQRLFCVRLSWKVWSSATRMPGIRRSSFTASTTPTNVRRSLATRTSFGLTAVSRRSPRVMSSTNAYFMLRSPTSAIVRPTNGLFGRIRASTEYSRAFCSCSTGLWRSGSNQRLVTRM